MPSGIELIRSGFADGETYSAVYRQQTYTVTFKDGESVVGTKAYAYGAPVGMPAFPAEGREYSYVLGDTRTIDEDGVWTIWARTRTISPRVGVSLLIQILGGLLIFPPLHSAAAGRDGDIGARLKEPPVIHPRDRVQPHALHQPDAQGDIGRAGQLRKAEPADQRARVALGQYDQFFAETGVADGFGQVHPHRNRGGVVAQCGQVQRQPCGQGGGALQEFGGDAVGFAVVGLRRGGAGDLRACRQRQDTRRKAHAKRGPRRQQPAAVHVKAGSH